MKNKNVKKRRNRYNSDNINQMSWIRYIYSKIVVNNMSASKTMDQKEIDAALLNVVKYELNFISPLLELIVEKDSYDYYKTMLTVNNPKFIKDLLGKNKPILPENSEEDSENKDDVVQDDIYSKLEFCPSDLLIDVLNGDFVENDMRRILGLDHIIGKTGLSEDVINDVSEEIEAFHQRKQQNAEQKEMTLVSQKFAKSLVDAMIESVSMTNESDDYIGINDTEYISQYYCLSARKLRSDNCNTADDFFYVIDNIGNAHGSVNNLSQCQLRLLNEPDNTIVKKKHLSEYLKNFETQLCLFIKESIVKFEECYGDTFIDKSKNELFNDFIRFVNETLQPVKTKEQMESMYDSVVAEVKEYGLSEDKSQPKFIQYVNARFIRKILNNHNADRVDEETISEIVCQPLSKEDTLNYSVGEVVNSVAMTPYVKENDDQYKTNSVFNNFYFGKDSGNSTSGASKDAKNVGQFAHIWLTFPVVNPALLDFKNSDGKMRTNRLRQLLGTFVEPKPNIEKVNDSTLLSGIAYYDWCLLIPKAEIQKVLKYSGKYTLLHYILESGQVPGFVKLGMIHLTKPNETFVTSNLYCGFYAARIKNINMPKSESDLDKLRYDNRVIKDDDIINAKTLSDRSFWTNNFYILTGAYAITYLLSFINVENELLYIGDILQGKTESNGYKLDVKVKDRKALTAHFEIIKNMVLNSEKSPIDYITNVIPVIPFSFRRWYTKEINGEKQSDKDDINDFYTSILNIEVGEPGNASKSKQSLRSLAKEYEIVPYEHLYDCFSAINKINLSDNKENPKNKTLLDMGKLILESITKVFFDSINCNNIRNGCKSIQEKLSIYSTKQIETMSGKFGLIRDEGLAKRLNDTARSVITADPSLELDEVGVPYDILKVWYKNEIKEYVKVKMSSRNGNTSPVDDKKKEEEYKKYIEHITDSEEFSCAVIDSINGNNNLDVSVSDPDSDNTNITDRERIERLVFSFIKKISKKHLVLLIRFPSLWKYNELVMKIKIVRDLSIHFHPLCCKCYNADFDGDTASLYKISIEDSVKSASSLMLPSKNKLDYNGGPMLVPSQDAILGIYYLTFNDDSNDIEAGGSNKEPSVRTSENDNKISRIIKSYNSYDEMFSDYTRGYIGLSDKVKVYLPPYNESIFITNFLNHEKISRCNCDETVKGAQLSFSGEKVYSTEGNVVRIDTTLNNTEIDTTPNDTVRILPQTASNMRPVISTVGRFIFNAFIPQDLGFITRDPSDKDSLYELEIDDKAMRKILNTNNVIDLAAVNSSIVKAIIKATIDKYETGKDDLLSKICNRVHDNIKYLGFHYATVSGLSLSFKDLIKSDKKDALIEKYSEKDKKIKMQKNKSQQEIDAEIINNWNECQNVLTDIIVKELPIKNPLRMMWYSGARGSKAQVIQLLAIRGIMLDPNSNPLVTPVKTGLREGMTSGDIVVASYGANKGMIDRARKTQDTGELTRTLIFGTEGTSVKSGDCGDTEGFIFNSSIIESANYNNTSGVGYINDGNSNYDIYVSGGVLTKNNTVLVDRNGNIVYKDRPFYNILHDRVINRAIYEDATKDKSFLTIKVERDSVEYDHNNNILRVQYIKEFIIDGNVTIRITKMKDYDDKYIMISRQIYTPTDDSYDKPFYFEEFTKGDCSDFILNGNVIINGELILKDGNYGENGRYEVTYQYAIRRDGYDSVSVVDNVTGAEYSRIVSTSEAVPVSTISQKVNDDVYTYTPYTTFVQRNSHDVNIQSGNGNLFLNVDYDTAVVTNEKPEYYEEYTFNVNDNIIVVSGIDKSNVFYLNKKKIENDFIGRFVADNLYDKYTGEILFYRDIPIMTSDKDKIKRAVRQYPEGIYMRSPITCKSHEGICAKCYGFYHSKNRYAKIGDQVDKSASHTLGEYLSQSTMRTFHTGGAAVGGNVTDTFEAVRALIESGKLNDISINRLRDDMPKIEGSKNGNFDVYGRHINSLINRTVRVLPEIYGDKSNSFDGFMGQQLYTKSNYKDKKMSFEDFGIIKVAEALEVARYVYDELTAILVSGGVTENSVHLEVITRALFQHVTVIKSGDSNYTPDMDVLIYDFIKTNVNLTLRGRMPAVGVLKFYNLNASAKGKDPLTSLEYRDVSMGLANSCTSYKHGDLNSGISGTLTGNTLYSGNTVLKNAEKIALVNDDVKSPEELSEEYEIRQLNKSDNNEFSLLSTVSAILGTEGFYDEDEEYKTDKSADDETDEDINSEDKDKFEATNFYEEYKTDKSADDETDEDKDKFEATKFYEEYKTDKSADDETDEDINSEDEDMEDGDSNDIKRVNAITFGTSTADN